MTTHEIEWNKDGSIEVRVYMDGDMNRSLYTKVANPETLTDVWKAHYVNELREKCKAFIAATEPESS